MTAVSHPLRCPKAVLTIWALVTLFETSFLLNSFKQSSKRVPKKGKAHIPYIFPLKRPFKKDRTPVKTALKSPLARS